MIKRNIKMRVTPEESKQVQEICFANGIFWNATRAQVSHLEQKYLYIFYPYITFGETLNFFKEHSGEEISAELFIRTQGTCVEETPKQELKQNINKEETMEETMEKNEVKSYANVKDYLIAEGLYEDVLTFNLDFEGYSKYFGNMFWFNKTPQGYEFWKKINTELIKLQIDDKIDEILEEYKGRQGQNSSEHIETKPDEYEDLRKALRAGKIIQLNGSAVNGEYGETWNACRQEDLFVWGRDAYRIKPIEQKPKQYLCYVQGKSLPKHIHKTLEQAKQEAQRLCRKELAKVSVLEVVAEYEVEVLVKEVL